MNKEIGQLIKRAEKEGAVVVRRSKHIHLLVNGKIVVIPSTPSCHRTIKNSISDLRRAGLRLR